MAHPTADVDSSLYDNIQVIFKGMNSRRDSQKGMQRWNFQKTVETHPSCSLLLMKMLVEELQEMIQNIDHSESSMPILPMLHNLYYAVLQSGAVIPVSIYQTVHDCLMKLLILPVPYSAVALSTLKSIKMEMTTPGSLYQRRVTVEQNLSTDRMKVQERVFVLADPAVFSAPLEAAVRAHLETSDSQRDTTAQKKSLVLRLLQTGLGSACRSCRLAKALGALEDQSVDKYFQDVVVAVEDSVKRGAGGDPDYMNKLQHIYTDILADSEVETKDDDDRECSPAMPCPEIFFDVWRDDQDLWNLLANFALLSRSNSCADREEKGKRDSGIERDLKEGDSDEQKQPKLKKSMSLVSRRNAFKNTKLGNKLQMLKVKTEMYPRSSAAVKEEWGHTARVVVMGDNRVLGKLAKAYYSIREKESKHIFLSKKLNLQLYYIPVSDVDSSPSSTDEDRLSLSSVLGRVDPWYDDNINSLQSAIPKLHDTHSNPSGASEHNQFLLDTLCYYIRCGMQPVNLPLYMVKMTSSDVNSDVVDEVFVSNLQAHIPEFKHLAEKSIKEPSARRRKSSFGLLGGVMSVTYTQMSVSKREEVKGAAPMTCGLMITSEPAVTSGEDYLTVKFDSVSPGENTEIQTKCITIKTMEHRTLTVCLDKDCRRTYSNVQRIEVSPCMDPGCNIKSRFSLSRCTELPLSKYLDKVLSLPINTFTGVTL